MKKNDKCPNCGAYLLNGMCINCGYGTDSLDSLEKENKKNIDDYVKNYNDIKDETNKEYEKKVSEENSVDDRLIKNNSYDSNIVNNAYRNFRKNLYMYSLLNIIISPGVCLLFLVIVGLADPTSGTKLLIPTLYLILSVLFFISQSKYRYNVAKSKIDKGIISFITIFFLILILLFVYIFFFN